ncbi:MAG: hypothetical protein HOP18_04785 [Deltaproteobacteria bacterium]|nr:hypothetical protein [Deltaproteobacteria bacterium]
MGRQTLWELVRAIMLCVWGGLILSGCGDTKTNRTEEDRPSVASSSSPSALSRTQGQVLAGRDLGMVVTGSGVEERTRSLDVLEHQLLTFLPQLQEVYDYERAADSGLMGSLDVHLTIEPSGAISDLRFPVKRVSSEKLTTAVYDRMRGWIFFPAESPVDLRYRLLFVPPGLETASITAWEKQLAGRVVFERGEGDAPPRPQTSPTQAPAVAEQPLSPVEQTPPAKPPVPAAEPREPSVVASVKESPPRKSDRENPDRAPAPEKKRAPKSVPGWFSVTRPSVLYAAPEVSADIVTRLTPGSRVWVVRVIGGDWLEVRSVKGRRPGFLPRETARAEQQSAGR